MQQLGLFENSNPATPSGKMFRARLVQIAAMISESRSRKCSAPKFQCLDLDDGQLRGWLEVGKSKSRGASWMLGISESPNDAVECSLLEVLEEQVHPKYYLSPKACRGILRRAEKRDKKLPELLQTALEAVAQDGQDTTKPKDL